MEAWKKTSKALTDATALKPPAPSESELQCDVRISVPAHLDFHLSKRFPGSLHSTLASILRAWLDQCPEDFQEPPDYPCLHRVMDYLRKVLPGSEALRKAEGLLEQLQAQAGMDDTDGTAIFFLFIYLFKLCMTHNFKISSLPCAGPSSSTSCL